MDNIPTTELRTTDEAAQVLRLHPVTLKKWRGTGEGPPFIRLGRKILYRLTDLNAWLDKHRCPAMPADTDAAA